MCDILLTDINGNVDNFNAEYSDCSQNNGEVSINLLSDDDFSGKYAVSGVATDGSEVDEEALVPNSERINPTKVFKKIADLLKRTLCPTCM